MSQANLNEDPREAMPGYEGTSFDLDWGDKGEEEVPVDTPAPEPEPELEPSQEQSTEPVQEQVPEPDDLTALRQQLATVTAELSQMKAQAPVQSKEDHPLILPTNPSEITSVDFLQGKDPADLLVEPQSFNQLLNLVATTAARAAVTSSSEHTIKNIPAIVQRVTTEQIQIKSIADDFYKKNNDLYPFRQLVASAAGQVYAEKPDISIEECIQESGKRVREILRLRKVETGKKPAQPVAGGNGRQSLGASTMSDIARQLEAMANL